MNRVQIPTARVFKPLLYPGRYKGAYGGRGSGKSHFFAGLAIDYSICNPGARIVCIREIQRTLNQSVKRLIEDLIKKFELQGLFRCLDSEIRTPGGGVIIFNGMQNHTAESIKSLEGFNIAWVEEAQALSANSLKLLRPTIREDGSELWFSWNPNRPEDPVDELFRAGEPPPNSMLVRANYDDNPWFPAVLKDEMEWDRRRDPSKYAHVWRGEYLVRSEAQVFTNWRESDFDTPDDAVFYFGADWGFSIDPTVLIRSFIEGRTLYVDREVFKVGCPIDKTPALFDGLDSDHPAMARGWEITSDNARPETIDYMRRHGYPRIRPSVKGKDSVKEGVEFLKTYDIVVHPRCRHAIDELIHYSYKIDPDTDRVLPVLSDKKNHVIDALRYGIEKLRRRRKSAGVW